MNALIITCFESNEERIKLVFESFKIRGYDTSVLTSDFSHIKKAKRNNIPEGYISVETRQYKKNLSLERMFSHYLFSRDAFRMAEKMNPDIIWVMAPANSLIKDAEKFKKKHPSVKIIVDIIDMWPESFPLSRFKNMFPFTAWRNIRSRHIGFADQLVSECSLYKNILSNEYKKEIKTLYWASEKPERRYTATIPEDKLSLCYLGSINNIIDIDRIYDLIKTSDSDVILHIVGLGENKDRMIEKLGKVCEVVDHGAIYDDDKKQEVLSLCHAGLNVYKSTLYIGLTVKSIDYFRFGLPVINSIKGDTWNLVENCNAGINVNENTVLNLKELEKIRSDNDRIYKVFSENFSKEAFIRNCTRIIEEVQ